MSKMAPGCACGHKASEHRRQMNMRTSCLYEVKLEQQGTYDTESYVYCPCRMYKSEEK